MVIIAFWDNYLCERGTSVALFDYAYYNETLLKNKSIVIYNKNNKYNVNIIVEKFEKHFNVYGVTDFSKVDNILIKNKCDMLYVIKYGNYDKKYSNVCKTIIHCVFTCNEPHGDIYASISPIVNGYKSIYPCVPHMINLPNIDSNLRSMLNISNDAIVYGRYGGKTTFDIDYVHKCIYDIAQKRKDIYFIFANTNRFCPHLKNIIHLDKIINLENKVKFINTCNAMIHARTEGETFGLSIGEFSIKNKPIITTNLGDCNHLQILKNKCILYTNYQNLMNVLLTFNKNKIKKKNWNAYQYYSPYNVMKIFQNKFINNKKYYHGTIYKKYIL